MSFKVLSDRYPQTFEALDKLLFPEEYSEYHAAIATLALEIYQPLETQFHNEFPERDAIISWFKEKRDGDLPLPPKLIKYGKIGEHYMLAFLECDLPDEAISHDKRIFYPYKSLAFNAVIRLRLMGLREDYCEEFCLELRMFAKKNKRPEISRLLPAIKEQLLYVLKNEITDAKSELNEETQSTFIDQLEHYINPLELLVSGKNKEVRSRGKNKERKEYRLESRVENKSDTDGNIIHEVHEKLKGRRGTEQWKREEHSTAPDDSKVLMIGLADSTKEPRANHFIAKGFSLRLTLRKKKLPTQLDHLTEDICQKVSNYCHANINKSGAQLILFVLLTGFSADELRKVKRVKRKNHVFLTRPHHLPTYIQPEDFLPFLPNVNRVFHLPLPKALVDIIPRYLYQAVDEAKEILSELNTKYKSHLTLERLRLNLRSKLTATNIDSAVIGIICGDALSHIPGLSYTTLCLARVFAKYKHYVSENVSIDYADSLTPSQKGVIGSNLAIKDEVIIFQLNRIKKAFNQSCDIPKKFYNLAVYTYYIVALFSAYRPVTAMLGYLSDINFITGSYAISDKENRAGISTRIVTLPNIALEQIKIYKDFMQEIINKYHCIYPALAKRCREALNESEQLPWLFFPVGNDIKEANPDELGVMLRPFFPMANNWHRHWARTKLFLFEIPRDITDGWIGHADIEEEFFGRYSGLSLCDLNIVSEKFDDWASKNEVMTIDA